MAYRRGDRIIRFAPGFLPFDALYWLAIAAVRLVDWLLYRIRIEGRENLRGLRRSVLVSNHTLLLDPGLIAHAIRPHRTYFTMLEETALVPFLGTFVRLLGGVPIPEGRAALLALEAAAEKALSELGFIHFFPEGECYMGCQDIRPFHPGAFLLACRIGLPVVPVTTVLRETRHLGRSSVTVAGRTIRFPPRVTIVIGAPVAPAQCAPDGHDLKRAALLMGRQVRQVMQLAIDSRGGSRALYRGKMPRLVKQPAGTQPAPRTGAEDDRARAG
jgi:1-acyl-sn-glycerol-3-phosphate acyltransferase